VASRVLRESFSVTTIEISLQKMNSREKDEKGNVEIEMQQVTA
jgi:hypothetical protein